MIHKFIQFLPDHPFKLLSAPLHPLVLAIVDKGGAGLGDELDERARVVGQLPGYLEPLVLRLH